MSKRIHIVSLFLLLALLSCNRTKQPYVDDYTSVSRLDQFKQWGTYNVHDPACIKNGDWYYAYSTDAIYSPPIDSVSKPATASVKTGNIQIRRSKDLVHWDFVGWALDSIPEEAVRYVHERTNGFGAENIWAPYVIRHGNIFRMYFCVSAFGRNTSWMGLAEAINPEGPWKVLGPVLTTSGEDLMNAIDPSVITDAVTGKQWLHYGSFFDGLYCVQLNPISGFALHSGDHGHSTARRADLSRNNVEAPEIMYHPELKQYYLFVSYDPLMTTYNIRVGRSKSPDGPFYDYFGNNLSEPSDHFPILTSPYRFNNHPGWAGTGHCGVVADGTGKYFVLHQGRLSPENHLMDLHVREIFWTKDGWPTFSPERYAGIKNARIDADDMDGLWEIIALRPSTYKRTTEAGQILWGENRLASEEVCTSSLYRMKSDGSIENSAQGSWTMVENNILSLQIGSFNVQELIVHKGFDWENNCKTLLFTGLDSNGFSIWGKKVVNH